MGFFQCIDGLHLANHRQASCHKKYNPEIVKKVIPGANLLCAEQTFSWQSRYARILTQGSLLFPKNNLFVQAGIF